MLAIKGMEMPKSCEECPFYTYYAGVEEADCRITGEETYNVKSGERHEKCPLKQEACEDCISRKVAIDAAWNLNLETSYDNEKVEEMLKDLPPVQPKQERRTGQWVKHDTGHSIYYDCSLCGCAAPATETADSVLWKLSNFCPDCGASMQNKGTRRITYTDDIDAGGKNYICNF